MSEILLSETISRKIICRNSSRYPHLLHRYRARTATGPFSGTFNSINSININPLVTQVSNYTTCWSHQIPKHKPIMKRPFHLNHPNHQSKKQTRFPTKVVKVLKEDAEFVKTKYPVILLHGLFGYGTKSFIVNQMKLRYTILIILLITHP